MGKRRKMSRKKRVRIALLSFALFVVGVLLFLQIGVIYTEKTWEHWSPDYNKIDILPILQKEERTEEDYEILYKQTGLTKIGIDDLLEKEDVNRILLVQQGFFEKHTVVTNHFNPFTYMEEIEEYMPLGSLQTGDIIVTSTTRVSWLRYGHAALVVDGEKELIAEAIGPGSESEINRADCFSEFANFLVYRPKVDKELKEQVAQYTLEKLLGIPYRFSVGIFYDKYTEKPLKGSQCAHLVWYAYKRFGVDLDSNGGWLIKPQDMALSEQVELVQAFGFDLEKLW